MKHLIFNVRFLSDIVLPTSSNTEGKIDQSDFIAGSNFLGMVAKNYPDFEAPFDLFHSGKVRFGDAHILYDAQPTYKIPYSYVHPKLNHETLYNHHRLGKEDFDTLGQLKQIRNGYMTEDGKITYPEYVYSQKSAYDQKNRRSLDSQMYGYNALKKGTTWQFKVQISDVSSNDEDLLIQTLTSSNRLGRSKSAEYGQVKITHVDTQTSINTNTLQDDEVILYCNSRLALIDECGTPTYNLKYLCEGLNEANIVYEKTQIRTSTFTPFNGARQTKDYERVCINKGSVIVLKNISSVQMDQIDKGIGAYLSEGFGEILLNPPFLMKKSFKLTPKSSENHQKNQREKLHIETEDFTVLFLQNRHNNSIDTLDIANQVAAFVRDHKKSIFSNIKPSQWGTIRSISSSEQENWLTSIKEYITKGSKKWEKHQSEALINAIDKHAINQRKFTQLLAMKMGGKND